MSRLIGILFGIYLIITAFKGKVPDLIEFIKDSKDFGRYIIAWLVLYGLYSLRGSKNVFLSDLGKLVNIFLPLFVIGFLLYQYNNILEEYNKLINKFQ